MIKHPSDGARVVSLWSHVRTWWRLVVSVGDGDGASITIGDDGDDGDGAAITIGGQEGRNPEKKRWLPVARGERAEEGEEEELPLARTFSSLNLPALPKATPFYDY